MRLDEHGRWVSDDGAYVWDESAQTWQPTSRPPGGATAAGPTAASRAGGAADPFGSGGGTGQRPAAPHADTGGYGSRSGTGQQPYVEPRTGSFPLFGSDDRADRNREASWSPVTGPYPQPAAGGGFTTDSHPLDAGTGWHSGAAPTRGALPARGGSAGDREPGGPSAGGAAGAGGAGTGQSRAWPARDPLGTGPYDRTDPLATGAGRGYDRADPLSTGPFGRADPVGTGSGSGSWSRDPNRGGPGRATPATGPGASRGGAELTGPLDSPGTKAISRPTGPVTARPDMTDPLPQDPARIAARGPSRAGESGGSGRFTATTFTKAGPGTGPRAAAGAEGRAPARGLGSGRADDDRLDDDDRDEDDRDEDDRDDEATDGPGQRGSRGRLRSLTASRFGSVRDEDDLADEDEDDEGIAAGRRASARDRVGKLAAGRGRVLVVGAAALVVVLVAVILVLKMTGGDRGSSGGGGSSTTAGRQYDSSVRKNYLDTCVGSNSGMSSYCNCTLEKLEASYSQDEFLRLNADVESAAAKRVIKEIRGACEKLK